jgi:eukaryotic-like serine/threonine-protein kinase
MATQVLAERYELGDRLGVGGMSTVVTAFDRRLERPVAVKLLAEHLAEDDQFVARFRREALSAARLVHPNVVQVFDFGLDERSGRHYIVMELVSGQSGAEILREEGVLGVQEALSMVLQACRGLD